ncbi:penicillin-binding protein 2 [Consotaella sp. CSK11QG-6]
MMATRRSRSGPATAKNRGRFVIAVGLFCAVYAVIGGRMVMWGMTPAGASGYRAAQSQMMAARPDLLDRNGEVLATDIKTASLYAEPRRIVDADEATELLRTVLPDLDAKILHTRLSGDAGFAWLKRELTPRQQQDILALGIPGIGFRTEKKRFYPGGSTAAHVVGFVNVDNQGIAGMEKYVDDAGYSALRSAGLNVDTDLAPVQLSLDLRVQHIVRDELVAAIQRYRAIAGGGIILDAKTGEVIAMCSLPDFDSNDPADALKPENMNRMTAGTYEMGSTFKTFTTAMALDSGLFTMNDTFDASHPLRIDGFAIHDYDRHPPRISVPEVFIYSSNIGSALEAEKVGIEGHKAFLEKLGLLSRMHTELPEVATPGQPKVWKKINSVTIAFGHGVMTTPLQTASAAAAILNGGYLVNPTFLRRTPEEAAKIATQVVSKRTSDELRYLYRLNVADQRGTANFADVPGYKVGAKTGTSEKVVNGRYDSNKRRNAFVAGFPMDDPQYIVLVLLDEPKPEPGKYYATAGWNVAPTAAAIIRRAAPLLKVKPDFGDSGKSLLVSY